MTTYLVADPPGAHRPILDASQWLSVGIMVLAVVVQALSQPFPSRPAFARGEAWETSDFIARLGRGYRVRSAGVGRHRRPRWYA